LNRSHELAEVLLRKAKNDEFAFEKLLGAQSSPDDVVGFHAQQAVEKSLKAVLSLRGVRYPLTHDLRRLLDLLRESSIPFPSEIEDVKGLTPFAAVFRYDDSPVEANVLDRSWALGRVRQVRSWSESMLRESNQQT